MHRRRPAFSWPSGEGAPGGRPASACAEAAGRCWRSGRRARVWAPGLPGACSRWEEEEVVARKARVRRPAAPPKLESELDAMEAWGRPGEGAPLPSETVRTRRSPPRPEPGKEGRPRLLRETLEAARPGDRLPPRLGCRAPRPDPGLARGAPGFRRPRAPWGPRRRYAPTCRLGGSWPLSTRWRLACPPAGDPSAARRAARAPARC